MIVFGVGPASSDVIDFVSACTVVSTVEETYEGGGTLDDISTGYSLRVRGRIMVWVSAGLELDIKIPTGKIAGQSGVHRLSEE